MVRWPMRFSFMETTSNLMVFRRMAKIEKCLAEYGIASLEDARALCLEKGIDVEAIVKGVQPIAFENAVWAYTLGVALALKSGITAASEAAATIGKCVIDNT